MDVKNFIISEGGESDKEPTMRDLRGKIAADLDFRDATEIIELLVCGSIINLDLSLRSVSVDFIIIRPLDALEAKMLVPDFPLMLHIYD